jgi:hypothetical protein
MPKAMKKGAMGMLELAKGLTLADLGPESKLMCSSTLIILIHGILAK